MRLGFEGILHTVCQTPTNCGRLLVIDDTILVTFYNAPNTEQLRLHYENLPDKLEKEGVEPRIPWLYGFKLDFRFK